MPTFNASSLASGTLVPREVVSRTDSVHSDNAGSSVGFSDMEDMSAEMMAFPLEEVGGPTPPILSHSPLKDSAGSVSAGQPSDAAYYTPRPAGTRWDEEDLPARSSEHSNIPPSISVSGNGKRKRAPSDDTNSPVNSHASKTPRTPGTSSSLRPIYHPASSSLDAEPVVIAYSKMYNSTLHRACWGTQWEIARYVATLPLGYTELSFADLMGFSTLSNKDGAQKIATMVHGGCREAERYNTSPLVSEREKAAMDPFGELDKEHEFIKKLDPCQDAYLQDAKTGWYGGKVHFTARLRFSEANNNHQIELDKPELGPSTKITRRFGSASLVRIKIDKNTIYRAQNKPQLINFLKRPFVIGGHIFRAFFARDNTVFLFRTNEIVAPHSEATEIQLVEASNGDRNRPSLLEFLEWFNDLVLNSTQSMTKWSARFALGLSNSAPSIRLKREDIEIIHDDFSPSYRPQEGKAPPTEMIMTDGCGLANRAFFEILQRQFVWDSRVPTAVQVRVFGAKGLLMQHPEHKTVSKGERPRIWLRDSQCKIRYAADTPDLDPAHLTVDVLRASHLTVPANLSSETIINLAENNVQRSLITDMLKDQLEQRVNALTTWDGSDGLYRLWLATAREGGVFSARRAREQVSEARVKGFVFEDPTAGPSVGEDNEGSDTTLDRAAESSSAWWWDEVSGSPSSLEETSMALLDAGFRPAESPVLCAKQKEVAKKSIKTSLNRYHVPVPMSCTAWAVPDPCGVLGPGEIYIESSSKNLISKDGSYSDHVLGAVLVTRHPCKVPTDVQKARAVDRLELHGLTDVVVVSTKDHVDAAGNALGRHLLSLTGGGDYDGDRVEVFWAPKLVEDFQPPPVHFATPPPTVETCLQRTDVSVKDFCKKIEGKQDAEKISALQTYLLGSLRDPSLVGTYSTYWETSMYKHGYNDYRTIHLAYMFCALLDSSKTGVSLKPGQLEKDRLAYGNLGSNLTWKEPVIPEPGDRSSPRDFPTKRGHGLPPFVMDKIRADLVRLQEQLVLTIENRFSFPESAKLDLDLTRPWDQLVERANRSAAKGRHVMLELVDFIKQKVNHLYDTHKSERSKREKAPMANTRNPRAGFTNLPIEKRQDMLRKQSREFRELLTAIRTAGFEELSDEELIRCLASYVYKYDAQEAFNGWSRYPWNVAMGTLCEIKAHAVSKGFSKTVTMDFYQRFTIDKKNIANVVVA